MILGICTEKPEKFIKEIGFQSTDRVGISLLPHFSKPEPDLELIGLKDFSVPKTECINFSDPEIEFEYFPKPEANKNDTFVRVGAESSNEFIKKNGSQSSDEVGIAFFPNFSDLSAKLGRVQVVEHNLKMKTICVYLTLITLYFSGIGASEFNQIIEKRWDEERNRTATPNQTWLIPHPESSSWGDLKDYNKVSLVKNIIGYNPG